jgi:hypothetical protein
VNLALLAFRVAYGWIKLEKYCGWFSSGFRIIKRDLFKRNIYFIYKIEG